MAIVRTKKGVIMTFLSGERHLESALCNHEILNDLEQAYQHVPVVINGGLERSLNLGNVMK